VGINKERTKGEGEGNRLLPPYRVSSHLGITVTTGLIETHYNKTDTLLMYSFETFIMTSLKKCILSGLTQGEILECGRFRARIAQSG
jgi:hypothetical protein